jgi:nitroreductase
MDVTRALETRIEVRRYTDEPVAAETKRAILDAARGAPSGKNLQHWRFVLVEEQAALDRLAELSTTGGWIDGADFAVVVLTNPEHYYHEIDAGRAITHMQLAAWDRKVGSCIYTGFDEAGMHEFLEVPAELAVTAVVGFGHPKFDIDALDGEKDRESLSEVVYEGQFGTPLERFE